MTPYQSTAKLAKKAVPLNEHGTNRFDNRGDNNHVHKNRGTDPEYLTAKIARDRPDILEMMKQGEFRSVRAAAIEAGIVKVKPPKRWGYDEILKLVEQNFNTDERLRLGREIIASLDPCYHELKSGKTQVAHYNKNRDLVEWAKLEGLFVYIGREMKRYGLKDSEWGNPYIEGTDGTRKEVIEKYRNYLTNEKPNLVARIEELRGKLLVCWCKPKKCHGDLLVGLLENG
jgi:hypothetical protein